MDRLTVDRSAFGQFAITGDDRVSFLQGMCTNDVARLEEGQARRASILDSKARLVSIVEIVRREDHLFVLCEPDLRDATIEFLDQYVMVDDVEFAPTEEAVYKVWPDAEAVWSAPPIFGAPPEPPADPEAVEVRRVEAGFPRYGADVGPKNFPFETPLDAYIDYHKGCYIGQEPVARVKSRGSPSKYLRGLVVEGEGAVPVGAKVDHPERKGAARVTSAVESPEFGSIALALLPRTAWTVGARVEVDGRPAEVARLPFGSQEPC